jgi:outer membrane protein OmpA-like peptidoglycan-associated protein
VGTDIRFEFDKAGLTEEAEAKLRHIGRALTRRQMAYARVCLEGNADTVGTPGYNDRLSERRALAVREFMLREFPELGSGQFRVEAQGETRPIEQPERDNFRSAINRRVEIRVRAAVPSRPPPRPHCRCPRCRCY